LRGCASHPARECPMSRVTAPLGDDADRINLSFFQHFENVPRMDLPLAARG